MFFKVF